MEAKLELVMESMLRRPNVTGIMFTDEKGLCVGTKDGKTPTMIQFDSDSEQLLIKQRCNLTGTVMKTRSEEPVV
ncbi:Hypothetical predicted protein [Cloeon dipterum]|uniref:Late endosomal/lysosomal adaptor and MAPK and MTOR activator 5 n=1 Tax=Cloeon dipterum TaxID=197152 RepID=A0A8S1DII5_9INSE|nr:Hypothetical predicted protein [Cloeon dipterum]